MYNHTDTFVVSCYKQSFKVGQGLRKEGGGRGADQLNVGYRSTLQLTLAMSTQSIFVYKLSPSLLLGYITHL
ncbi:hypothetical protein J6590_018667 [Homalodisca vitripennis]|nr:hypothetical protein J6590_018667 [Homalodisca vitripennis]